MWTITIRRSQQQLQIAQQQAHQVQQYAATLAQEFANRFPEIRTANIGDVEADVRTLASYDPDRATEAVQYLQQAQQAVATQQQAVVGQQTLAEQALAVWGQAQDEAFIKAHPELRDANARAKARQAAIEVLRESGLSDAQIQEGWRTGRLRSVEAQNILLMAARQKLGETAAKNLRPKPPYSTRNRKARN